MKKKLLEKDGFYLALFACVCLIAIGGVIFTKNNVDELASNNGFVNKADDDELRLIENDEKDTLPTTTESNENLEKAKEKQENTSKLSYLGEKITREYSDKKPSYSKTLDVWEVHKGLDISAKDGAEVKSLLDGKIESVFKDDKHGVSIKITSKDDISLIYSNLSKETKVKKGDQVKSGQVLGTVGNTSSVESQDGVHIHLEAYKGKESIDPMTLIK